MCFVNEKSTWKCFYPISSGTEVAPTQLQLLEKSVQAEISSWLGPNGTRVLLSFQGRSLEEEQAVHCIVPPSLFFNFPGI